MKAVAIRVLKTAIGIALLAWLVASVDVHQIGTALQRSDARWIVAGLAAFASATFVGIVRLQVLFRELRLTVLEATRMTIASYFFNQLLPTSVGGDAYRALRLKELTGRWPSAIGPLLFERLAGALALLLPGLLILVTDLSAGRLARAPLHGWPSPRMVMAVLAAAVLIAVSGLLFARHSVYLGRTSRALFDAFRSLPPARMVTIFVLSVLHHALRVSGTAAFLAAVGHAIPFSALTVAMALTLLGSLVPITIGALGVREGILASSLAFYGVPYAAGVTVALLNRAVVVILGLAGFLVFYRERHLRQRGAGAMPGPRIDTTSSEHDELRQQRHAIAPVEVELRQREKPGVSEDPEQTGEN